MNVKVIRYDLEYQPGFVSFEFRDIKNKLWTITEKLPVVGLTYPEDESHVPFEFKIPSKILGSYMDKNKREIFKIEFLYHIESYSGDTKIEVFARDYNG